MISWGIRPLPSGLSHQEHFATRYVKAWPWRTEALAWLLIWSCIATRTTTGPAAVWSVSRGMTRVDTTPAMIKEGRFAGRIGLERVALVRVSRGTTQTMVTLTVTERETRYACPVGTGHLVRHAWRTGLVPAALNTVCLRIATNKDITSKCFRNRVLFVLKCLNDSFWNISSEDVANIFPRQVFGRLCGIVFVTWVVSFSSAHYNILFVILLLLFNCFSRYLGEVT